MSTSTKSIVRKRNANKRTNRNNIQWPIVQNVPMPLTKTLGIANEVDVKLKFTDQIHLTAAAGFKNYRFNPNAAYDVDPSLGSTSTAFFSEYAGMFNFYRVRSYSYTFHVVNLETFPQSVYVLNTNNDPGFGSSYVSVGGNAYTQIRVLAGNTGGPCMCTISGSHTVVQIVGSIHPETDDGYQALTNTVPANKIWLSIGVDSFGLANLTNGVVFLLELTMNIRFSERKTLTS